MPASIHKALEVSIQKEVMVLLHVSLADFYTSCAVSVHIPLAGSSYAALAAPFLQHWQQTSPSTGIMHSRSRGSKHPAALTANP
jgi:hypothetical protein